MRPDSCLWELGLGVWLALAALLLAVGCAQGRTYYVSARGPAGGDGSARRPFASIQQAAEVMQPGDTCLVRGGGYRETVRPARSGEPGRPITFTAYGGEVVIVSSADPVAGWQREQGRIYRAPAQGSFEQLFVEGRMMNVARWPNAPLDPMRPAWAVAGKGTGKETIVDPDLPAVALAGAMAHVLPGAQWVSWTRPVTTSAAGSVTIKADWKQDWPFELKEGSRYYLFGLAALLDAPGEWHLDREQGVLRLWAPAGDDPGRHRVEAKRRELAFDLHDRQYVQVEGFRIFAATIDLREAAHCRVVGCHVRYASHSTDCWGWGFPPSGIMISGHDNLLADSSVIYSAGDGVMLWGERNTVRNCLVRNTDYMATDCASVRIDGRGHVVSHCTLSHTGRSVLVHHGLRAGRIEYNDLHHAGLLTRDLGITYCYGADGEGTVICYNLVHDNQAEHYGVGIYLDNGCSHFLVHHNVCYRNTDSGIRLNIPSHGNLVYHNTCVRNLNGTSYWAPDESRDQAGSRLVNNLFTDEVKTGEGIEAHHNYVGGHPGFVNAGRDDYRLRSSSPCVNAGVVIPGVTFRPVGAPDLGAYEHGAPAWQAGHDGGEPPVF